MRKQVASFARQVWDRSTESLRPVLPDVVIFIGVWLLVLTMKWGPERAADFEVPRTAFITVVTATVTVATVYLAGAARWLPNQSPEERPAQALHSICIVIPVIFLMITTWMTISWANSFATFTAQAVFAGIVYAGLVIYSRGVVDAEYEDRLRKAEAARDEARKQRRSARVWRIVGRQIRVVDGEVCGPTAVSVKIRLIGIASYFAAALLIIGAAVVGTWIASSLEAQAVRPYIGSFALGVLGAAFLLVVKYFGRLARGGVDCVANGLLALMYSLIYLVYVLQYLTLLPTTGFGPALVFLVTSVAGAWGVWDCCTNR